MSRMLTYNRSVLAIAPVALPALGPLPFPAARSRLEVLRQLPELDRHETVLLPVARLVPGQIDLVSVVVLVLAVGRVCLDLPEGVHANLAVDTGVVDVLVHVTPSSSSYCR